MTPVERLQAAIEKLEVAKRGEMWGPAFGIVGNVVQSQNTDNQWRHVTTEIGRDDADLIVVLHRTIDAQLAILRFGLQRQYAVDWTRRTFTANDKQLEAAGLELALAEAIIGTTPAPALIEREFAEVARFGIHPELEGGS